MKVIKCQSLPNKDSHELVSAPPSALSVPYALGEHGSTTETLSASKPSVGDPEKKLAGLILRRDTLRVEDESLSLQLTADGSNLVLTENVRDLLRFDFLWHMVREG